MDHSGTMKMRAIVIMILKARMMIYGACFQFIDCCGVVANSLFNLINAICFPIILDNVRCFIIRSYCKIFDRIALSKTKHKEAEKINKEAGII